MNSLALDSFEQKSIEKTNYDLTEKMDSLNKSFKTSLQPEKGVYGITELKIDENISAVISRNESGHIRKDYYSDGNLYLTRQKIDDNTWQKTKYDDAGTAYLTSTTKIAPESSLRTTTTQMAANTEIVKGNFSAQTDYLGRPIKNKITNAQLKDSGRESLSGIKRGSSYMNSDERGHLIPDSLGGPASQENIIAQAKEVNRSEIKTIEDNVRKMRAEGHTVDYEVKCKYKDNTSRPSSFEVTVTCDGKVSKSKIYNSESQPSLRSKIGTNLEEGIQSVKSVIHSKGALEAHSEGLKGAKEAAMVTFAMSTVENVSQLYQGEITAEEMVIDIAKDTGTAGLLGYGTGFVSSAVSSAMRASSHSLISSLGSTCLPTAVISFGIDSFDTIVDYAQGNIDEKELAYDLGESASGVAGSMSGAAYGAAIGTAILPVGGTVVGGIVGGMVGYAVTTEAYESVVDTISDLAEGKTDLGTVVKENVASSLTGGIVGETLVEAVKETGVVDKLAETGEAAVSVVQEKGTEILSTAEQIATDTIDQAKSLGSDAVDTVKNAFNNFNVLNNIPLHFA